MAVSALLRTSQVEVSPGGAARCHVLIRNNSAVVDQFEFGVRGDVDGWTKVKPERVNLMPQQEVPVELTFQPPRSSEVLAGEHPFALQVSSREDPAGSVVQEGVVTVEPFTELDAGVVPATSSARRVGKHTLAIDNLGNHAHPVEVTAEDPDARLTFKCRPRAPRVEPGTTTFVKVKARPRKYFWKGHNRKLPFAIKILVPDADPVQVDAALEQMPLVPNRFFWLFTALFALLMILVFLVMFLLRQQPQSIAGPSPATDATTSPVSSAPATSTSRSRSATSARRTTTAAAERAPVVGAGSVQTRSTPTPQRVTTTTFTIRTEAYPGGGGDPQTFSYVVPPGPSYRVTSVVLRNPADDRGEVRIRHEGKVIGTIGLSAVSHDDDNKVTFRPDDPPLVAPGERVTLAVTCANDRDPCTPSGVFTAALVR